MTEIEAVKNAQRLCHVLQAIARIQRSVNGIAKDEFFANEDKQGNVIHCIEIVGEAVNHLSSEITDTHPEFPWRAIVGMRNHLIHGYNEIDVEYVWTAVKNDLVPLEEKARQILSEIQLPDDFTPPSL